MFGWAQWAFVQEWVSMRFYFELVLVPCRCLYWQYPVLSLCTTCAKSNMGTRSHQVFVWSEVNATEADTSTSTALIMSVCMSVCIVLCTSLELPLYIVLSHCANIHWIRQTDMSYGQIFFGNTVIFKNNSPGVFKGIKSAKTLAAFCSILYQDD